MNSVGYILVSAAAVSIALGQGDFRTLQCIQKCESDNGIKNNQTNVMQVMAGKCLSNDKFAKCLKTCNQDMIMMLCYQSERCSKLANDKMKNNADAKEPSTEEACSKMINQKDCNLVSLKYTPSAAKYQIKQVLVEQQKSLKNTKLTDCKNLVDGSIKYLDGKITFKSLEKIYADNAAITTRIAMLWLPLWFLVVYAVNQ